MPDYRLNRSHLKTKLRLLLWLPLLLLSISSAQQPVTTIAVLEFEAAGVDAPAVQTLANVVRKELIKSKLFRVVERNLMDEILSEQGLQQSGCTTTECVVEVGRLLGVQKILSGSISKLGELFIIDLQITNITTGEIEVLESIDYVGKLEELPRLIRELTTQVTTGSLAHEKETVLYVTSNPVGAKVYLDEKFSGNTPLKLNTDLENIAVRVSQAGYSNWAQSISINQNETNIVEANLVPVTGTNTSLGLGQLTINCDQSNLEIFIDGGLASKTPMTEPIQLFPGTHEISFYSPEYRLETNRQYEAEVQKKASDWGILYVLLSGNSVKKVTFNIKAIETGTKKVFIQAGDEITVEMNWNEIEKILSDKQKYLRRRAIARGVCGVILLAELFLVAVN